MEMYMMMESISSMDSELPSEPSNPVDDLTDTENTKAQAATSSPISKLPVELLAEIFRLNIPRNDLRVVQASNEKLFQRKLGWVVVTWVCRQWRNIALNHATLWAIIPLNYPTWSLAMFERSKTAGIVVDMHQYSCSPRCRERLLPFILANGPRVAGLTLHLENSDITSDILGHFASTPRLSTLNLAPSARAWHTKLPNNVFQDVTCLRNLELRGFDLDWNSHLLCNPLQELSIIDVSRNARPTMSQLGRVLQNVSPTLKTLVLMGALPRLTDERRPISELNGPFFFPLLERLDLEGEVEILPALFNAIQFSNRLEEIDITTTFNHLTMPHIISFLTSLNRNVCFTEFCTTVAQLVVGFQGIHAFAKDSRNWQQTTRQGALQYFALDFRCSADMIDDVAIAEASPLFVEDFFRILPWTNLRKLTLELDWNNQPMSQLSDVLRRTFGTLNGIKCLTLSGTMTTKYGIEALYIDGPDSITTRADPDQIPLPALRFIRIISCNFNTSTVARTADSKRVLRMAEKRDQLGFPIANIEFRYSIGLTEKDISSLEGPVSVVVWHEYSNEDEYDEYSYEDESDDFSD